jgi:hypothetical protein
MFHRLMQMDQERSTLMSLSRSWPDPRETICHLLNVSINPTFKMCCPSVCAARICGAKKNCPWSRGRIKKWVAKLHQSLRKQFSVRVSSVLLRHDFYHHTLRSILYGFLARCMEVGHFCMKVGHFCMEVGHSCIKVTHWKVTH